MTPLRRCVISKEQIKFGVLFRVKIKSGKRKVFIDFIEWDIRLAESLSRGHSGSTFTKTQRLRTPSSFYEAYLDRNAFEEHQHNQQYQQWVSRIEPEMVDDQQPFSRTKWFVH